MTRPTRIGAASVLAAAFAAGAAASVQVPALGSPLSASVPHDVDTTGVANTLPAMEAAFNEFSWRSFVALNWPARPDGTPDRSRQLGQRGDAPTVVEYWPMAEDVFPAPPATPAPWGSPPHVPAACAAKATRVFAMFTKAPATRAGVVGEFDQALHTGPLIDRSGAYVRYAVQLNRDAFDFIVANRLYEADAQRRAGPIAFPAGDLNTSAVGSITTKAAWKVLSASDDVTRFHTTRAWVYTPAETDGKNSCVQKTMGLVGFHIAHKTRTRPQWVWSTFEQIDNAPPDTARASKTFFDPTCSGSSCAPNVAVQPPWDPSVRGVPTQVTRLTPIRAQAAAANTRWQARLRGVDRQSPWQYYMLVDTQWPTRPDDTQGMGAPNPPVLANTVIETFIQTGGVGTASSCTSCHRGATVVGSAAPADYSYLLLRADHRSVLRPQ